MPELEPEPLKKAEQRGYLRGYKAGRTRKHKEIGDAARNDRRSAFWRQALLESLNGALTGQTWMRGDKRIETLPDRVQLAREVADEVLQQAERLGRI